MIRQLQLFHCILLLVLLDMSYFLRYSIFLVLSQLIFLHIHI
uniref:Dorsal1 n=1 Tax=Harmonia axyridis TaxID=115357 RepID=A0A1X9J0E4_HARAX|nr:dorsal1 [Harmonia axyridis]